MVTFKKVMSSNFTKQPFDIIRNRHTAESPWHYRDADLLQNQILGEILAETRDRGVILMNEFSPVITLGKRRTGEDLLLSRAQYQTKNIEILEVDRGGRATYHGPGQWVVFVVDRLERLVGDRKGVRKATCALLDAACQVVREKYPDAEIREGDQVGVWESQASEASKIVSIGIQIERGVLKHGISMNVFQTPESFYGIDPCGIKGARPGFLESVAAAHSAYSTQETRFMEWGDRLEKELISSFKDSI